jgi:hypothetical protein
VAIPAKGLHVASSAFVTSGGVEGAERCDAHYYYSCVDRLLALVLVLEGDMGKKLWQEKNVEGGRARKGKLTDVQFYGTPQEKCGYVNPIRSVCAHD